MTPDSTTQAADRQRVIREQRRQFQERFRLNPLAFSIDGRTFTFQAPMGLAIATGSYVRLTRIDGMVLLGQILSQAIEKGQGAAITVSEEDNSELANVGLRVSEAVVHLPNYTIQGNGIVLGVLEQGDASGSDHGSGFYDAEVAPATAEDIAGYLAEWGSGRAPLPIGSIAMQEGAIEATIDAAGFNRHSFLCGQSGSGKTYSLGVVLERLLAETTLRIAILDPNADYVKLGELRDPGLAATAEGQRYLERVASLQVFRPTNAADDASTPLRVRFSDLATDDQARTLRLDPLADRSEFDTTMRIIGRMADPRYSLQDVQHAAADDLSEATRQVMLRIANLGIAEWDIWADQEHPSIADTLASDWQSLVFDLSRFERPIERSVVALATLRHFWRQRESRQPVLLVIDEAHNVCPAEPLDPIQAAVTDLLVAIAGEGRKYGLYLFLATQRPDKLHPNVISQCDNLMLMRMNSQSDIEDLARIFSFVPPGMLNEASSFRQGEALLAGKLVPSPTIMRIGARLSAEGGSDVATAWATSAT